MNRKLVILESPFANGKDKNIEYARRCIKDSLMRNESPIASHLLYTQPGILDDDNELERRQGIEAGLSWYRVAEASVVYIDLGISNGMKEGIERAKTRNVPIEYRTLSK